MLTYVYSRLEDVASQLNEDCRVLRHPLGHVSQVQRLGNIVEHEGAKLWILAVAVVLVLVHAALHVVEKDAAGVRCDHVQDVGVLLDYLQPLLGIYQASDFCCHPRNIPIAIVIDNSHLQQIRCIRERAVQGGCPGIADHNRLQLALEVAPPLGQVQLECELWRHFAAVTLGEYVQRHLLELPVVPQETGHQCDQILGYAIVVRRVVPMWLHVAKTRAHRAVDEEHIEMLHPVADSRFAFDVDGAQLLEAAAARGRHAGSAL